MKERNLGVDAIFHATDDRTKWVPVITAKNKPHYEVRNGPSGGCKSQVSASYKAGIPRTCTRRSTWVGKAKVAA